MRILSQKSKVLSLWIRDTSTYPVVLITCLGPGLALGSLLWHAARDPDIILNKQFRKQPFHYTEENGVAFKKHRENFARMDYQPIQFIWSKLPLESFQNLPGKMRTDTRDSKGKEMTPDLASRIEYSEKYVDDTHEYRHVILPKEMQRSLPDRLLTEMEWRQLGVQQSRGWVHYAIHRPEPHILLFRRPLGTDPTTGRVNPSLEREAKDKYVKDFNK